MNYIEFNPHAPLPSDSKGTDMGCDAIMNKDQRLLESNNLGTRFTWPLLFNGVMAALEHYSQQGSSSPEKPNIHAEIGEFVQWVAAAAAEFIGKDYDLVYKEIVKKQRTVMVDVTKTRKVGLFKKETYVEQEARTEEYDAVEEIAFKGWLLERLIREAPSENPLFIDYCLSADGKLYTVISEGGTLLPNEHVFKCVMVPIDLFSHVMTNTFANVYALALGGSIGVLDAVPLGRVVKLTSATS